MRMALAPSLTACAIRCACTWPSSAGGVIHTISIEMLFFCDSSLAAASAPVRAERNTGLVELFAIIAILSAACVDTRLLLVVAGWSPPRQAPRMPAASSNAAPAMVLRFVTGVLSLSLRPGGGAGGTPGGEAGARAIQHDCDDGRAADDDPFVILIEVERADRLSDEDDEQRAEHRADGAALAA